MKLRELPMTPLTRESRPSAMICRKVTSTWLKTSAAHCCGSGTLGSQCSGFRNPRMLPEWCEEGGLPG